MSSERLSILQVLYKWSFLACLAVLPMSHTTALRNVLLALMLLLLLVHAVARRSELPGLVRTARPVPWPLLAWFAFLLLFPLWAVYPQEAWANLRGQWMGSMIAWVVGFGAVWVLGRKGPGLWALALASAIPLAVHLLSFLAVWLGLLGSDAPASLSFSEAWTRLARNLDVAPIFFVDVAALFFSYREGFPQGFWGLEPMHGNLGYAACQAIALFSVLLMFAWRARNRYQASAALMAILLCAVSILIASSRGAFLYAALMLLLAVLVYLFKIAGLSHRQLRPNYKSWSVRMLGSLVAFGLVGALAFNFMSKDVRWQTMLGKVKIGFSQPHPEQLLCDGLSPEIEAKIRQDFKHRDPAYVDDLIYGLKIQDGGRILLMREGWDLVLAHPRGLDGGRTSYQKLITEKCGHPPKLVFAHLHQSWMDMALALGWLGAALFAWLLLSFVRDGWQGTDHNAVEVWALALFLISVFWFSRGFADSLYREHYLQMQALLLSYLYGRMNLKVDAAT